MAVVPEVLTGSVFSERRLEDQLTARGLENVISLFRVCAVQRRRFPVGANPTRRNAPAGSNRSSYVTIILQKLHVRTRTEAALLAEQHGAVGRSEKI